MLLEIDVKLENIQVGEDTLHPPHAGMLGSFACPLCSHTLHGHGWRKRYFIDVDLVALQIWIHRKICPQCLMTFTLLPPWVHALKLFSVSLIKKVLEFKIQHNHFSSKFGVAPFVQKKWYRRLIHKARTHCDFYNKEDLHNQITTSINSLLVAPLFIKVLPQYGNSKMSIQLLQVPHQRLLLFLQPGSQ